jgi:hypothetical protein
MIAEANGFFFIDPLTGDEFRDILHSLSASLAVVFQGLV